MYTLFGNKWLNLHSGPMWKVEGTQQDSGADVCIPLSSSRQSTAVCSSISLVNYSLMLFSQARVNIPALSARTIQRGIASSDFTITSDIQVRILKLIWNCSHDKNYTGCIY